MNVIRGENALQFQLLAFSGQEIVIHEAPPAPTPDSPVVEKLPPHRPGSPNPKPSKRRKSKKSFDFEIYDSSAASTRETTPTGDMDGKSMDLVAHGIAHGIMSDVFKTIDAEQTLTASTTRSIDEMDSRDRAVPKLLHPKAAKKMSIERMLVHKKLCATKSTPVVKVNDHRITELTKNEPIQRQDSKEVKNTLMPPSAARDPKFRCSPFSDVTEIPVGSRQKRGSMPEVGQHRKLTGTKSSPAFIAPIKRRMSDNFLSVPDEGRYTGSPYVRAEFLQKIQVR